MPLGVSVAVKHTSISGEEVVGADIVSLVGTGVDVGVFVANSFLGQISTKW
jgi:hypothetical protein